MNTTPNPAEATALGDQMRSLAATRHARADDLRRLADAFDAAAEGFYATPRTVDVKTFVGHWTRARRCWCECTGERLIA